MPFYSRDTRAAHRPVVERVLSVSLENLPFTPQKQCGGKAARGKLSALRRRLPTLAQRWFDDFTLEQVVPIRLQALEYLPEVTNVPGLDKLQCVNGLEKNPLRVRGDRGNVCPSHVNGEGKMFALALVSEKIDEHARPRVFLRTRMNYRLADQFPDNST